MTVVGRAGRGGVARHGSTAAAGAADRAVADVVDDAPPPNARRLLVTVAATVVAQRCGCSRPMPRRGRVTGRSAADDLMAAAETWRQIVATELLLSQWLDLAAANGWRPSPDVLADLLRRNVNRPAGHAVMRFGGPSPSGWWVRPDARRDRHRGRPHPPDRRCRAPAVAGVTGPSVVADVSAVPPGLLRFERCRGLLCRAGRRCTSGRYTGRSGSRCTAAELLAARLSTVLAAITRERERAAAADATADVGGIAHARGRTSSISRRRATDARRLEIVG